MMRNQSELVDWNDSEDMNTTLDNWVYAQVTTRRNHSIGSTDGVGNPTSLEASIRRSLSMSDSIMTDPDTMPHDFLDIIAMRGPIPRARVGYTGRRGEMADGIWLDEDINIDHINLSFVKPKKMIHLEEPSEEDLDEVFD